MPKYLVAYTLAEHEGAFTTPAARADFKDGLSKKGYKQEETDKRGRMIKLPETTLVGEFADDAAAANAIGDVEKAVKAARPDELFLTHCVVTPYRRAGLRGPDVIPKVPTPPKPPTKPSLKASGKPTPAGGLLQKVISDAILPKRG